MERSLEAGKIALPMGRILEKHSKTSRRARPPGPIATAISADLQNELAFLRPRSLRSCLFPQSACGVSAMARHGMVPLRLHHQPERKNPESPEIQPAASFTRGAARS